MIFKKSLFAILIILLSCVCANAQLRVGSSPETQEYYSKARQFIAKKDYANAILVFNQLVQMEPRNIFFRRELAQTYSLAGDYTRATKVIMPLLKAEESDDIVFFYAGQILMARNMRGEAMDAVTSGIKKFPTSGVLYELKGKLWNDREKYEKAVESWEKGIQVDPRFHMNYYNLAKSYFVSKRPIWAIIYGESFINLNKRSRQADEMKRLVFDSYKQLMSNIQLERLENEKYRKNARKMLSPFEREIRDIYSSLSYLVAGGVTADNITMLRTRFLLDWMGKYNAEKPYALFEYLTSLTQEGHFDAYNRWLFGQADSKKHYDEWLKAHPEQLNSFESFFYGDSSFRPLRGQYYK